VFFSFPHTAINDAGELGVISRPNRPGDSCACGALAKVRSFRGSIGPAAGIQRGKKGGGDNTGTELPPTELNLTTDS
jgi:hypothetical protein